MKTRAFLEKLKFKHQSSSTLEPKDRQTKTKKVTVKN